MELLEELQEQINHILDGTNLREVKRSYFRACNILTKMYDTKTELLTMKGENNEANNQ